MVSGNQIDLYNLILIVVVVVCSYGLALILTVTCWNSYTRHRSDDVYCTSCLSPSPPAPGYASGVPPPGYSLGPGVPCQFESHTADQRLGLLVDGAGAEAAQVPFSAQLLSSAQPSLVIGAGGDCFLQPDDGPSPPGCLQSEEGLDRDTTLSRSFRSSLFQSQSSPLQMFQMEEVKNAKDDVSKLTLHERFSAIKGTENNEEADQFKMNQVRVLTSPPATDNILMASSASRTPSTAREKVVKQRTSRRSLRSMFGRNKIKSVSNSKDPPDTAREPVTTDTNLDTTDNEEVFLSNNKNSVIKDVDSDQPPLKPRRTSDWTDPKKGRKVGSPGRTGNADFFIRQAPLRSVDIDLGPGGEGDNQRSEYVRRTRMVTSRSVASAPQAPVQSRASLGGAKPKDRNTFLRPPSLRKRSRTRPYNPASESEITDFSADEDRRQGGPRMARLELPPRDLGRTSPGSSEAGDISVTPPPPASTDVSPEASPLGQYSSVSFTQSDMDLICSPNRTEPVKTTTDEAESLQWDDYDHQSELSFRKTCEGNSNSENQ